MSDVFEELGLSGNQPIEVPKTPFVPLDQRKKVTPVRLSNDDLRDSVPEYVFALPGRPTKEALKAFGEALDAADVALDRLKMLEADIDADRRRVAAEAVAAGSSEGIAPALDADAEKAVRTHAWSSRRAGAVQAHRHLLAVASSEAPKRVGDLVKAAAEARTKAAEKIAEAEADALRAVELAATIRQVDSQAGLTPKGWWRSSRQAEASEVRAHLSALRRYLESPDRVQSGEYVLQGDLGGVVPDETIEWLRSTGRRRDEVVALGIIAVQDPEHRDVRRLGGVEKVWRQGVDETYVRRDLQARRIPG